MCVPSIRPAWIHTERPSQQCRRMMLEGISTDALVVFTLIVVAVVPTAGIRYRWGI